MTLMTDVLALVAAAILEVGGIALVRMGLQRQSWMLIAGAVSLVAYGVMVNQGRVDFGRLMGGYIAVFFVTSQVIAILLFADRPSLRTLIAGSLIAAGGITMLV